MKDHREPARRALVVLPDRTVLDDTQWAALEPLLPPQKPATGKPNKDHRLVVEGMLWVLRTGAPWRDLPKEYGPHSTVANRFYRWRRSGVFDEAFGALLADGDAQGTLDWLLHYLDATVVRAHQHAAGAPKGGSPSRRPRSARRSAGRAVA